jgi:ribulose-bisphosphate carboxylase large chain
MPPLTPTTLPSIPPEPGGSGGDYSKVIRHNGDFTWQGVPLEAYKATTEAWSGITRRELSGKRGETQRFHVRYFEIAPGGFSTLEEHEHEHVVIPLRGRGEVQFGCSIYRIGFGDVVYIAAGDPHQFRNAEDAAEPFGFLCMVNAERDAPRPVDGSIGCTICE